jgi:DNA polymerase III sliding clamp (beta) subunit (PCNA family)
MAPAREPNKLQSDLFTKETTMRITASKAALTQALRLSARVATKPKSRTVKEPIAKEGKTILQDTRETVRQITDFVRVQADQARGCLVIESTDLELRLSLELPVEVEAEGSGLLNPDWLIGLLSADRAAESKLSIDPGSGAVSLETGTGKSLLKRVYPEEEYPPAIAPNWSRYLEFNRETLLLTLSKLLLPFMDSNLAYTGIYLRAKETGAVDLFSTLGGFALALTTLPANPQAQPLELILPERFVKEATGILRDSHAELVRLEVAMDNDKPARIALVTERARLSSALIARRVFDPAAVIPESFPLSVRVPVGELLGCLKRAALFALETVTRNKDYGLKQVELSLDAPLCLIQAEDPNLGSNQEQTFLEIVADTRTAPGPLPLVLNADFVTKALSGIQEINGEEAVLISASNPERAICLRPANGDFVDYRVLIMPMVINSK